MNSYTFKNDIVSPFANCFIANQSINKIDERRAVFEVLDNLAGKAKRTEQMKDDFIWGMVSLGASLTVQVYLAVKNQDYERMTIAFDNLEAFGMLLGEHYPPNRVEDVPLRASCHEFLAEKGIIKSILSGKPGPDEVSELMALAEVDSQIETGFRGKQLRKYMEGKIDAQGNKIPKRIRKMMNKSVEAELENTSASNTLELAAFMESLEYGGVESLEDKIIESIKSGWNSDQMMTTPQMANLTRYMYAKVLKKIAFYEERELVCKTSIGRRSPLHMRELRNVLLKLPAFKTARKTLENAVFGFQEEMYEDFKDEGLRGIDAGLASGQDSMGEEGFSDDTDREDTA